MVWCENVKFLSWTKHTIRTGYQVIQVVTFLSPRVGGHQQPLKGLRFHSASQKGRKESPACLDVPGS